MTTMTFTQRPVGGSKILNRAAKLFSFAWVAPLRARLSEERAVRTAIAELRDMDDRTLEDMGIRRSEISRAVRGR